MTTRQTSRYSLASRALACVGRSGVGPALALALCAGAAPGQGSAGARQPAAAGGPASPAHPQGAGVAPPRSSTAGAASSMVSDKAVQEQSKKKVGKDDDTNGGEIKVDANQIVDLHVKDEDLTRVLELLSIQSQRNIIPTKSVNARVSANLYGVTFYEALDALLHPNGFGWMERNNRIEVYTLEELKQIEAASRTRIAKVIKLNYLNAVDAGAFVEALLSEGGQIKTNGKTSTFAIPEKTPVGQDDFANEAMLVVYDYEENVAEIERLVREIDTRPAQVLVEATILQTQLNEANAFGVDFAVLGDLNFTDFSGSGGPLSAVNSLISGKAKTLGSGDIPIPGADGEGRAIVSGPGNTSGPGDLKIGFTEGDVAVFIKMLDEVGDTTIISNPKVLALNRQPARVLVGRKVGYLNTTSTDTTTTQSVEFLDTGTQLYFRPFVTNEGVIRLELKPAVSEAVIRDAKDATGAAVTIPDEITNEIVTNVLVRDGQTVVLGGLFRESTESSRRQVPFLGDIPLLGAAFRGHDDATNRNEIIFMITPTIVSDQVLVMQGERGSDLVDKARTGSRESLLPWSREKMSGQLLVEAGKLADDGKENEALWKIEQSLSMNHNQPEAIALREKLSNKKVQWPGRSMLNRIIDGESVTKPHASAQGAAAPASGLSPSGAPGGAPTDQGLSEQKAPNATATPNIEGTPSSGTPGAGTPAAGPQCQATPDSSPQNPGPQDSGGAGQPPAQPGSDATAPASGDQNSQSPAQTLPETDGTPQNQAAGEMQGQGTTPDVESSVMITPSEVQPPQDSAQAVQDAQGHSEQGHSEEGQADGRAGADPANPDGSVSSAGLSELTAPGQATTTDGAGTQAGNEAGSQSGTQAGDQAGTQAGTQTVEQAGGDKYVTAWAWFYTGFRGFFVPSHVMTAGSLPTKVQAPHTEGGAQDGTVSNAGGDQ